MKLRQYLLYILVLIGTNSISQNENNIWYFGENAGLDFSSGSPVALTDGAIYTVEVLFVSLDEDLKAFYQFATQFPFISITDLKKWNSPIAKDYYVFSTPTMYLLDKNRSIILRPNSVNQMNAWVDWYLVKGNSLPKN